MKPERDPHDPDLADTPRGFLRVFLGIGVMMMGCSVITLLALPTDSPEFMLSICNIFIGLALVLGVVLVSRLMR